MERADRLAVGDQRDGDDVIGRHRLSHGVDRLRLRVVQRQVVIGDDLGEMVRDAAERAAQRVGSEDSGCGIDQRLERGRAALESR